MTRPGVNFLIYYEDLDYLMSGYEDSRIRIQYIIVGIWGYNEETIQFVTEPLAVENANELPGGASEGATNRVAGMSLKATLLEHREAVTGMVCFPYHKGHWMVYQY